MRTLLQIVRWTWALPATLVGLLSAAWALVFGARTRVVDGVLEIWGGPIGSLAGALPGICRFDAITFGHVVIGRSEASMAVLRIHEHAHVRQYERWGLFLFPAYLGSSAWQWLRGRDPYYDNRFEVEARRIAAQAGSGPAVA